MQALHQQYFDRYLATLSEAQQANINHVETTYFCADEYNTNECARLVSVGQKRATCSVKAGYAIDNERLPQVGDLNIVLDWKKQPVCIVKVTEVSFCPFGQVSREFAESEGEGDGSYEWWYKEHEAFFTQHMMEDYGLEFGVNTELVLVSFELVYK